MVDVKGPRRDSPDATPSRVRRAAVRFFCSSDPSVGWFGFRVVVGPAYVAGAPRSGHAALSVAALARPTHPPTQPSSGPLVAGAPTGLRGLRTVRYAAVLVAVAPRATATLPALRHARVQGHLTQRRLPARRSQQIAPRPANNPGSSTRSTITIPDPIRQACDAAPGSAVRRPTDRPTPKYGDPSRDARCPRNRG